MQREKIEGCVCSKMAHYISDEVRVPAIFHSGEAPADLSPGITTRSKAKRQLSEDGRCKSDPLLTRLTGDFTSLSGKHTSTPYSSRLMPDLDSCGPPSLTTPLRIKKFFPSLSPTKSCHDDSGICDNYDSAHSPDLFIHPASVLLDSKLRPKPFIQTPEEKVRRSSTSPISFVYDFVCSSYESDLAQLHLPKTALLSQFEAESSVKSDVKDDDSAFGDFSFSSQLHEQESLSQTSDYHSLELDFPSSISSSFDLDFEPSLPDDKSAELFEELLRKYSPAEPDRLIGRKMGIGCLDIIAELSCRNLTEPLERIFGLLSSRDLCSVIIVSRTWQTVIESCESANRRQEDNRRQRYVRDVAKLHDHQKENLGGKKVSRERRGLTEAGQPCQTVQAVSPTKSSQVNIPTPLISTKLPSPSKSTIALKFWKEATKLHNDERLSSCPRCRSPARTDMVQERAWCSSPVCGHDFCTKCHLNFHNSSPCTPSLERRTKADCSVGSRKSKKNLKRL